MRRLRKSFGHALDGFVHALRRERNLQLFLPVYIAVLLPGIAIGLLMWEWIGLILAGGTFLAVELLNTALERLSDVLDGERKLLGRRSYHEGIKATKDVAAAASLVSLLTLITVICIVYWPYMRLAFS